MTATAERVRLTDQQCSAVETLAACRHDVQTMGGFAGTGKTTVIRELVDRLPGFAVCAYTGKAAQVLRRKGVQATTIHSLIYRLQVDEEGVASDPPEFDLVAPWMFEARGVIVDEASMVGADVYRDLKTLGVPLIFVGDHGQLEPVNGGKFNLMAEPQVTLTEIHRNAGEIARFAEWLRNGCQPLGWLEEEPVGEQVNIITSDQIEERVGAEPEDQIICSYNRTRVALNAAVRKHLGHDHDHPVVGDRIMCLQNDRRAMVYNGMQGVISRIDVDRRLTFRTADDREVDVRYNPAAFGAEKPPQYERDRLPFDWCYAITGHKSQGDEWRSVTVFEQRCDLWDHIKWSYTCASRAKEKLTWVVE